MTPPFKLLAALLAALSLALAGCATQPIEDRAVAQPPAGADARSAIPAVPRPQIPDRAWQERLLALNPAHITDRDVRETLAHGPTPRIILLHGGLYPVHLLMGSFGRFLSGMGYPEARIRDPGDNDWSYSPYEDSAKLAGIVAWDYERNGVRPMMIGHSQGGMQAVKVLHELSGHFSKSLSVYDPKRDGFEERTTIVDPLTRQQRPVVGVSLAYVSVVGAGGAAFLLPNQWSMLDKLNSVPDTVDEFTGFFIGVDLIAWSFPGANPRYTHNGSATVRNVELPVTYSHIFLPLVGSLADEPEVRDWINAYAPGDKRDPSALPGDAPQHVLWAADVWYSIKNHWCIEAQRWLRAVRAAPPAEHLAP